LLNDGLFKNDMLTMMDDEQVSFYDVILQDGCTPRRRTSSPDVSSCSFLAGARDFPDDSLDGISDRHVLFWQQTGHLMCTMPITADVKKVLGL
jgi:hypothetical protein